MKYLPLVFSSFAAIVLFAQQNQHAQKDSAGAPSSKIALDQMIKAGKSPLELAQFVFDTQGCKNCHTVGHDGKLGYTDLGKQRAQGYEGCVDMLTAMTVIVQVAEEKRSPQQHQKAERFEEFGCTACHKLAPGKLALTEMGTKLANLHLGCVDVEKLTSSRSGSRN
jgi:cytochrome c2